MGGQWLRRRGEKEQKRIGDDSLEKTVSGRYRGREAKRGFWRASDVNLKALTVLGRQGTDRYQRPSHGGKQKNIKMRVILPRVNWWIGLNEKNKMVKFFFIRRSLYVSDCQRISGTPDSTGSQKVTTTG